MPNQYCRAALAIWLALAFALAWGATPAASQTDYRNLDDGRPVATEDAYAIERGGLELLVPYRVERPRGGDVAHAIPLELTYGIVENTQLAVRLPIAGVGRAPGDGTTWGLDGIDVSALYNFTTEGPTLPALAIRGEVHAPVGGLGGRNARVTLKAIATHSWGRFRLHLNAARGLGSETGLSALDPAPRWRYGAALDRTLFRRSMLVVGEVSAARAVAGAPVEVDAAAGIRWQWTPTLVADLGLARRLRDEVGPDYALSFGLSHAFALGWLMPARVH